MNDDVQRIRVFAGPNGSGKSSLVRLLAKEFSNQGQFHLRSWINADDIEARLRQGPLLLDSLALGVNGAELLRSLHASPRLMNSRPFLESVTLADNKITAPSETVNSYVAATIADFVRQHLIHHGNSFGFETVLSHPSKLDELERARDGGAKIYLYFIATESPDLNEQRIRRRVLLGEHDVPSEKIAERYYRSLSLLPRALRVATRAYLFDNSAESPIWFAEKLPTGSLEWRAEAQPRWFHQTRSSP